MPIINSVVAEDRPQIDGRRAIREQHTDHLGRIHTVEYLAGANEDVTAVLSGRATQIAAQQQQQELASLIDFSFAGNDPRSYPLQWNRPQDAFRALTRACLTADAVTLLRFAVIAAEYTIDELAAQAGLETNEANTLIGLAQALVTAKGSLDSADATRAQIAAMLGV